MGEHLALLVDRLLTESTLEAAVGSRKQPDAEDTPAAIVYCCDIAAAGGDPSKMVECRICQEEDWDAGMEAPCACRGSLKYAHRKCIQRWCNEKGDTVCEICLQFLALLVLRHTLPLMVGGDGEYSFALFLGNQGTYMFFSDTEDEDDDDEEEEEDAGADPALPRYQPRLVPVY
uniref:E3 ubiquitin-protein ligase MARCH8 n=1 Tax=Aegilops tauschii TaxID=37682 RepID=M8AUM3_AEGTA